MFEKLIILHEQHDEYLPGNNIYFSIILHTWKTGVTLHQMILSSSSVLSSMNQMYIRD